MFPFVLLALLGVGYAVTRKKPTLVTGPAGQTKPAAASTGITVSPPSAAAPEGGQIFDLPIARKLFANTTLYTAVPEDAKEVDLGNGQKGVVVSMKYTGNFVEGADSATQALANYSKAGLILLMPANAWDFQPWTADQARVLAITPAALLDREVMRALYGKGRPWALLTRAPGALAPLVGKTSKSIAEATDTLPMG